MKIRTRNDISAILIFLWYFFSRASINVLSFYKFLFYFTRDHFQFGTAVLFAVGRNSDPAIEKRIIEENKLHGGDMIQQDFLDTYHNLSLKVCCNYFANNFYSKFFETIQSELLSQLRIKGGSRHKK